MKKNTQIQTLFLDIGGVLLTNGWDHDARKKAAATFSLNFEEMEKRHNMIFDLYEIGKVSLDYYLDFVVFYEKKRRAFTKKQFQTFMFLQSKALPKMIPLMKKIKEKNRLKIFAVNNEGRELMIHRIQTFNLSSLIDCFISSGFVGLRKPDVEIFRLALDLSQTAPENILYIEDRPIFIEIAKTFRINAILHTDYESTCKKLKSHGLIIN